MRMEPHGLGIDRHRTGVTRKLRQIAAMQADGHDAAVSLARIGIVKLTLKRATNEGRAWKRQGGRRACQVARLFPLNVRDCPAALASRKLDLSLPRTAGPSQARSTSSQSL